MEEKNKGSYLGVIIITVIITLVITLGVVYFAFLRKPDEPFNNNTSQIATNEETQKTNEDTTNTQKEEDMSNISTLQTLTNEESIALAKNYINKANNFIQYSLVNENDCVNPEGDYLCFYKTKNNLETDLYKLFTKRIIVDNILMKAESNLVDKGFTYYTQKNNKIYIKHMCDANGLKQEITDYTVVSKTEQKINVKYKVHLNYDEYAFGKEDTSVDQLKKDYQNYLNSISWSNVELIKENNEWRINKVTLLNICGHEFIVG